MLLFKSEIFSGLSIIKPDNFLASVRDIGQRLIPTKILPVLAALKIRPTTTRALYPTSTKPPF